MNLQRRIVEASHKCNWQWVDKSLQLNQGIHVVGSSLLSLPMLSKIDFSHRFEYRWTASLAVEKIVEQYPGRRITLLIDQDPELGQFLQEYKKIFDTFKKPNIESDSEIALEDGKNQLKDYLERWRQHFINRQDVIDIPRHWTKLIESTGLYPAMDIATIDTTDLNVKYIGQTAVRKFDENKRDNLYESLVVFYQKLGYDKSEIGSITTGSTFSDSFAQQWIIPPQYMKEYNLLFAKEDTSKHTLNESEDVVILCTDRRNVHYYE